MRPRPSTPRTAAALLWAGAIVLTAGIAAADDGASGSKKADPAAAEALFNEGRKLLKQGLVDAACPKFAESYRLDPALGSLLNLASCHEKQGRIASAWGEFRDAEQEAAREGDRKRQLFAAQKVRALEPRLPKLKIVAVDPPPGMIVRRDEVELSSASLGVEIPVDPGLRMISVEAPGYENWSTDIEVREKKVAEVSIPALTPLPEEPPPAPAAPLVAAPGDEAGEGDDQRIVGLVLGGVGVASFAAAGIFALLIVERQGYADDPARCPAPNQCTQEGFDAIESARGYATISTITLIAGAVLISAGAVVYLTAPEGEGSEDTVEPAAGLWIAPDVGVGTAGVRLGASF
jgi:hypothetical protein